MDDQFNGRTDDDLFADDFEPVPIPVPIQEEIPAKNEPSAPPVVENQLPPTSSEQPTAAPVQPAPTLNAPRSLAQSRHAHAKQPPSSSSHHHPRPRKHSPKPPAVDSQQQHQQQQQQGSPAKSTTSSGIGGSDKKAQAAAAKSGQNTALADRLASGANPRTKLTESELASKMEQMRILNAEKTRRFEQAERDSRSHAIAYEKGMEEARRRRAEEAERRRRGEEERRRMDDERAANRERKLKAMGAKEGGSWDEGKNLEDERDRRAGFRGANGGIRGARSNNGGIAGSRFAERDNDTIPREFGFDDFRGRGRGGRGRGGSTRGGGRGGRGGGFNYDGERDAAYKSSGATTSQNGSKPQAQKPAQAPPTAEDFPALPPAKKPDTANNAAAATNSSVLPLELSSPIGKWDDEMAALDAQTGA
ncbi:uncharacterized protein F4812DRAFT_21731 [Daldinia caldariorum]|uniref:uncharacterized protein n=1 Tax=Daldinia caldariorum TaxID=326644 RepID=UPI002008C322|nr:uncharacterized protein F4812DRAFT_21731 [Daldinia caldariorum]KAI1472698.1 hypothetical protein F4812DRAFT_21731 [Daldinia caldariorum]